MQMKHKSKVAVVTGGARGLGYAMSCALASDGWKVFATHKHARIKPSFSNKHENITNIKCDLGDREEVKNLECLIAKEHGYIDALINNAGINCRQGMWEIDEATWDSILNTNLKHQFFFTRNMWELVLASDLRRIIFIASAAGEYHGPKTIHYAVSKAGIISLTKVLARYGAKDNVFVNAISPGLIETEQTRDEFASGAADAIIKNTTLLQRQGFPSDVVSALRFLTDEKQRYMTGQVLSVSGGAIL